LQNHCYISSKNSQTESGENGEVIIDDERIKNSNIIDIVHDLTRDRKNIAPMGTEHVINALRKANIPREFIGNKNRHELFDETPSTPHYSSTRTTPQSALSHVKRFIGWQEDN